MYSPTKKTFLHLFPVLSYDKYLETVRLIALFPFDFVFLFFKDLLLRSRRLITWHIYILVTKCQRYLCKILCKDRRREIDAGPDGVNFPAGFIAEGPEWVWHHQFCQKRGENEDKEKIEKKIGWLTDANFQRRKRKRRL